MFSSFFFLSFLACCSSSVDVDTRQGPHGMCPVVVCEAQTPLACCVLAAGLGAACCGLVRCLLLGGLLLCGSCCWPVCAAWALRGCLLPCCSGAACCWGAAGLPAVCVLPGRLLVCCRGAACWLSGFLAACCLAAAHTSTFGLSRCKHLVWTSMSH